MEKEEGKQETEERWEEKEKEEDIMIQRIDRYSKLKTMYSI